MLAPVLADSAAGARPERQATVLPQVPNLSINKPTVWDRLRGGESKAEASPVCCCLCVLPQVFDLSINKPGPVMRKLWANFDEAAAAGDEDADATRAKLRVLVAGGDGTIAWWGRVHGGGGSHGGGCLHGGGRLHGKGRSCGKGGSPAGGRSRGGGCARRAASHCGHEQPPLPLAGSNSFFGRKQTAP
eukprot:169318-Chlamydomonas_euryale.AAC.6